MSYREIRVRPVVRYLVTSFTYERDGIPYSQSVEFGEFDNVERANAVAYALGLASPGDATTVEPALKARKLRIDWKRGPGEPREATKWHLSESNDPPS